MIKTLNYLFVTFFGAGKVKFAPGTFTSFITILLLFYAFHIENLSNQLILTILLIIFFYSFIAISGYIKRSQDKDPKEIFNTTHQVYIDTLKFESDFLIAKNKKDQIGFETYINIKNLSEGKHIMRLKRLRKRKKDTIKTTDISIPFWYFKK